MYVTLLSNVVDAIAPKLAGTAPAGFTNGIKATIAKSKAFELGRITVAELQELEGESTRLTGRLELVIQGYMSTKDAGLEYVDSLSNDNLCNLRDLADIGARTTRIAENGGSEAAKQECNEALSWAYAIAERLGDQALERRIGELIDNARP
ncbi:hypothetical protein [Rhodopirellula bahusiensis]|uniref:hypothetical protein n=1 Tax=Rhodopirellula bahusiensis TaxID=2014065 RepID=UPI003266C56F